MSTGNHKEMMLSNVVFNCCSSCSHTCRGLAASCILENKGHTIRRFVGLRATSGPPQCFDNFYFFNVCSYVFDDSFVSTFNIALYEIRNNSIPRDVWGW